ncbi:histone-lysine N-methyltransferase SETMAR [Trichonephila clavata]|uniref:Histone-lysine N-methyltransferase SETMAR n=1 Tax=Trichonephila clavata TaxID=2740835 RepID=A0A8X6K945_TRICU|nr:histone-lysine N-methyltransferase SETMAR [Trichonephila clavata]
MEVTRVEQRAYIKIAVLRGRNAMECHSELVCHSELGNNALPYRKIAWWVGKFQQGRVATSDEQRSGRPEAEGPSESFPSQIDGHRRVGRQGCHCLPLCSSWQNSAHRDFLVRQARRGVRDKRPDLVDSATIPHDNARPHKAECALFFTVLCFGEWEELEQPPYSPDISPCDFNLIPKITKPIRGRWFATLQDISNAVRQQVTRFTHGVANAEANGIQHLSHRWQRVVTVAGDYIKGH